MGYKDRGKRIGAATGASIAMDKMALEQNQQLIDSFDLQYQGKIELLKTQGKMNEAVALENKYYAERDKLLGATNQTKQQILNNYMSTSGDVRSAYNTGTDKSITATYKDTPMADIATQAVQMLNDSKMGDRTKQNLKIELSTKGVDPLTMVNLLSTFTNPGDIEKVVTVIDKFGGKFGGEAINTIQGFVDKDGKPLTNLQTNYMIAIGTKTTQEAEKFQNFFITLTKMKAVIPAAVSVSYFMDPANKTALDDSMLALDKIQALSIKEKLKVKVVADIINDPKAFDILNSQASEFDKLPPEQQKVFASVLETFLTTSGTPEAQKQMEAWRKEFPGKTDVEIISTKINQLVKAQTDFTTGVTSATTPTTTGNRNPWAFLDDVVKQLRDTRDAAIDAAKPLQVLKDLMSGKLKLEAFGGLTDKFRSITMAATGAKGKLETVKDLNPNENLLSALQGLDPKDFKTISKALFTKNKAGDITGFSKKGLAVNQIFDEAQVGKYTDSLAKQNVEILNQQKAYMKLTVAGVSASQALEITGDAALAASIASENIKVGTTEWDLFIANVQKAKDLLKTNEQFKIGKAISAGDYTTAFSSGYDAIQKIFNIQERLIALKYKGDRDLAANAVKAAETEIAANSYKISRYQYGLDLINTKADEITQKYNDQFAALDKIRSVNDAITQQKQTQIDLASSLSRGDISSAAKAMETLRQQRANSAMENARKAMENQRDSQINALTDANGLTKVQLEEKIKQLSDANKKIQYETVDVKNEVIRLIDLQIEKENSSLTVAGKTKDAWDALAIKVDAAEVATGKFDTAIAGALTTATALELKWKDIAKAFDAYQQITAGVSTEQKAITGQVGTSKTLDTKTVVDKTVVPTSTVVVKSGDTLSAIAKKAGVSLSTLIKANPQIANPNLIKPKQVINLPAIAKSEGGMVPSYFAAGGYGKGTDTIPAMLTPGEFVVKKYSVDNFGVDNLKAINNGTYNGNSVYNYNLSVNVGGLNTSADDIARTVMSEIRRNESQRVRGIK
jgi:LysM repeat protein